MRSKSTLSLFMVESGRAGTACACPSCLLCYLNVARNRGVLSLIVFCWALPRLKIGCLCRTENGLASRAKRALFAALAAVRTLPASHLASKVAWSHFALVGEICPQAPLNDFCKIGCAPAELSSPASRQRTAALCEYIIDTFSVSGYT